MNALGSWKPVVRDEYYHSKREAGLIGAPEEYMSSNADEAIEAYIDSMVDADV
jgi:hypothetical protein